MTTDLPPDFKYKEAFLKGRPVHDGDAFAAKHPRMDRAKRAKLFAPFDALDGYSDSIDRKKLEYVPKRALSDTDRAHLDRQLQTLMQRAPNGAAVRDNPVTVTVEYYLPCSDESRFGWRETGTYEIVHGIFQGADLSVRRTVRVADTIIPLDNIWRITIEA